MSPIQFYFDFSSPYGYLAATQIEAIGREVGRDVVWHPFLLGVMFKHTGQGPLMLDPMRGEYFVYDMERCARRLGVPLVWPEPCPFMSQTAARGYYWLVDQDPERAKRFAEAVYTAAFGQGRNVSDRTEIARIAESVGTSGLDLLAATTRPEVKKRLHAEMDEVLAKKIFGSPTFLVDGERYFGHDRMTMMRDDLRAG